MSEQKPAARTRDVEAHKATSAEQATTRAATMTVSATSSRRRNGTRPGGPVKILFVSANPGDRDHLVVDEEYRAIEQRIRQARHREAFQLIACPAARRSDLQDALLEHAPHIVHFACHGSRQAEIDLLGDGPGAAPVSADSLASIFEVLHDDLVLVVFNACFASTQASAVRPFATATIGMQSRVTDRASIAFASALYGALAYGRSVQEAFELGCAALDPPENQIPALFERTPDAGKLHLVTRSRRGPALMAVLLVCALVAVAVHFTARTTPSPEPDPPFVLDTRLAVHRSQGKRSITLDELRSGDVIMDGDRLQLSARTSSDSYLYVAFCSQRWQIPGVPGLSVFPAQGEVRLSANRMTQVPVRLVVDNHPGIETLYVILSRHELSRSDARLAEVLAIARREQNTAECGARFHKVVAGPRDTTPAPRSAGHDRPGGAQQASSAVHAAPPGHTKPSVTRGIDVVWDDVPRGVDADADGIVVLRYEFTHVPAPVLASDWE